MGIGLDIKEVLQDVGVKYNILGGTSGEYLIYESNAQVTKPFIREFFLEVWLSYDTTVKAGDVLQFVETSNSYLTMHHSPDIVENEIIKYDSVLYKCNVSGELLRPSGEGSWGTDYNKSITWETVRSSCYGLQVENLYGGGLEEKGELGELDIEKHTGYFPTSYGFQVNDRYQPRSGEYYRVENVIKYRFPAVDIVVLGEDTR